MFLWPVLCSTSKTAARKESELSAVMILTTETAHHGLPLCELTDRLIRSYSALG